MKKILTLGSNDVAFECAAVTPYFYKAEFGRDYFADMMKMSKAMQDIEKLDQLSYDDLDHVDLNVISQLAWACAKTADRDKTKPYKDWLIENPDFNMFDHGTEIADLIIANLQTKKKVTESAATDDPMTTEYFQVICKECGLSFDEMASMNIGDAMDVVYTYIELHDPKNRHVRKATQSDIDRF